VKRWHDKKILNRQFIVGQYVLLYNTRLRLFPGKLKSRWTGPYEITHVSPFGAIQIKDPKTSVMFKVNGQRLKIYHGGNSYQTWSNNVT